MARVAWIEELRLLTNQIAADRAEILQIAERARDAKISAQRVLDELNERVTRVKSSAARVLQQLSGAGLDVASDCALFIDQLARALSEIDVASVESDPVTAAMEHVIDALWRATLCHAPLVDTTALSTCSESFSEPCWAAFIDSVQLSRMMNDTRDLAQIFDTWFAAPSNHVYYSCWRAQWRSMFDTVTAVTSANHTVPPNIDISVGTAISGSRDQCAYYAVRKLLRHEFDFETLELRGTQVTANLSVPLYSVLSFDGSTFIALIR